ncbi:hypothetical protein [Methylomicrobium sp. Wu6]|uniref:hypothetical protein n=1 Tax=Methylomicrobium sp. Wu6 TaxID=3107928 RepID=UPI002DD68A8E|nr:hypothetical protein [Methylomicrobium sp. Wu6]MEC4747784.1 hypothetical protein [Methylomicrobium sp. Wu6]
MTITTAVIVTITITFAFSLTITKTSGISVFRSSDSQAIACIASSFCKGLTASHKSKSHRNQQFSRHRLSPIIKKSHLPQIKREK